MNKRILYTIFILLISHSVTAQELVTSDEITPIEHALTGWATAVSGQWAVVTSPQRDVANQQSVGGATFYRRNATGWTIAQEVLPAGLTDLSNFGMSVAIDGNTAVIGAIGDHDNGLFSGAVYVYTYNDTSWIETTKLKASDPGTGERFGHSVDIRNGVIVVGAYQADGVANKSGAAYIFEQGQNGWEETRKIVALNGKSHDYFGYSVHVMDGDNVAIGAYNADGAAERSGAVYTYTRFNDAWIQIATLFDPNGSSSDLFGFSLASGNPAAAKSSNATFGGLLFVGAPGSNQGTSQTGSVYIYSESNATWTLNSELTDEDSKHNDHFGSSLAFNNSGGLYVGANRVNTSTRKGAGEVYIYQVAQLSENTTSLEGINLSVSSEGTFDHLGTTISASEEDVIVSAPYTDTQNLENSGAVHFFSFVAVDTEDEVVGLVDDYELDQNYPNPFNPTTTIRYQVKESGLVRLTVFNVLGQTVSELVNETKSAGIYQVSFDASQLSSGIYIYRMQVNDFVSTRKMLLVK